jgi:hypothetical protein
MIFADTNGWDAAIALIVTVPSILTLLIVTRQRHTIRAIDEAVNGRGPGEPTLSQDVTTSRLRDEAQDAPP